MFTKRNTSFRGYLNIIRAEEMKRDYIAFGLSNLFWNGSSAGWAGKPVRPQFQPIASYLISQAKIILEVIRQRPLYRFLLIKARYHFIRCRPIKLNPLKNIAKEVLQCIPNGFP